MSEKKIPTFNELLAMSHGLKLARVESKKAKRAMKHARKQTIQQVRDAALDRAQKMPEQTI